MLRLACKMEAALGEGPLWHHQDQALWCVDIAQGRLHRFDPSSMVCRTLEVGGTPSFVLPCEGGGLLIGNGRRLYRLIDDHLGPPIVTVAAPARHRTNDATVDQQGRLWFGTMDESGQGDAGTLYRMEHGVVTATAWQAVVPNGPAVSCDGMSLYHVDTMERTIWRIPLDQGVPRSTGEVFLHLDERDGFPDGVVIDAEDCLWVALWDGWAVRRYSPTGEMLLHIKMPCARPTKLAFGGADLKTAFVTSARTGLDPQALREQPLAGSLFALEAPAPGRPLPAVKIAANAFP